MHAVVLTVDQHDSRSTPDQVPTAVAALSDLAPARLPFQRTAGDEFQGVLDDPAAFPSALEYLLRSGVWNIGVGIGEVETPLPDQARAGRGPAYVAAREAVTSAKSSPWRVRVSGPAPEARALESALWLWAALLGRRTERGWEVADLVAEGLTYDEAATRLQITQSAVSQRAAAAGIAEGRRARELAEFLARTALVASR